MLGWFKTAHFVWSKYWSEASISSIENLIALITVPVPHRRVSDGGPDHPRWVGAICPTCHRNIHHGIDGLAINEKLMARLGEIEAELPE
jgi:hypothetical protein